MLKCMLAEVYVAPSAPPTPHRPLHGAERGMGRGPRVWLRGDHPAGAAPVRGGPQVAQAAAHGHGRASHGWVCMQAMDAAVQVMGGWCMQAMDTAVQVMGGWWWWQCDGAHVTMRSCWRSTCVGWTPSGSGRCPWTRPCKSWVGGGSAAGMWQQCHAAMQPCSRAAMQPCSHAAMQPCSQHAYGPCALAPWIAAFQVCG